MGNVDAIAEGVAAALEGASVAREPGSAGTRRIEGRHRGMHVRAVVWYANGSHGWTVETNGAAPPLLLTVRRRRVGEESAVASGAITDVGSGDPGVDRDWLVEGAPTETVRALMDEEVRARFGDNDVTVDVDGGKVRVSGAATTFGAAEVTAGVETAAVVRGRLSRLAKEGGPPRAEADRAIADLRARREKTFARMSWPARIVIVVVCLLLAAGVLGGLRGCLG